MGLRSSFRGLRHECELQQAASRPRRGPIVDGGAGRTLAGGEGSLVAVGVQPDRIKDPEPL